MWNLAEYRSKPDRLADLLPWAALVARGVVLNKDGSFQRTMRFRGHDLESSTETQLVSATSRLNNVIKRFGSGWALYIEARREPYNAYPEKCFFDSPLTLLVEAEQREKFSCLQDSFESKYFLTLQFLPESSTSSQISRLFLSETNPQPQEDYRKSLDLFIAATHRFGDILQDFMYEVEFLDDNETLSYLHSTVSAKNHPVVRPETPMYLDALLADTPLLGGIAPELGNQHLRVVTIVGFPASTTPAMLDQLNQLTINYRFVTRFIALDKADAEALLKSYKRM